FLLLLLLLLLLLFLLLIRKDLLKRMLAVLGVDCDVADEGEMAAQKADERKYALILMDYFMPKMNGIEVGHLSAPPPPLLPFQPKPEPQASQLIRKRSRLNGSTP